MDCGMLQALLLPDLKNYLDVTWTDDATDAKIWGMAQSGMAYLDSKAGGQMDYTQPGFARSLLMDYVRYMRDGALDIFEANYLSLILAMQNEVAVNRDEESETDPSDG